MPKQLQLFHDFYKESPPRAKGLRQGLRRFFFGDDIFISYSRADAGKYAMALAVKMSEHGYLCFLDQMGTDVNRNMPESLKEKVRASTALVLIGTEGAASSRYVREEVTIFKESGRPIHHINVEDALSGDEWPELAGLSRIPEVRKQVERGEPSAETITQLKNSTRYRRRNQVLRLSLVAGFSLIALTVLSSVAFSRSLTEAANAEAEAINLMANMLASEKVSEAETISRLATSNADVLKVRNDDAQISVDSATANQQLAIKRQGEAETGMRRARTLEREANERFEATKRQEKGSRATLFAQEPGRESQALALALEAAWPEFASVGEPSEQVTRGIITSVNALDYSLSLENASGEIHFAHISPDGRKAFGASYDRIANEWRWLLWDGLTGKVYPLDMGGLNPRNVNKSGQWLGGIKYASFSHDGSRLLVTPKDNLGEAISPLLWDVSDVHHPVMLSETKCGFLRWHAALDKDGRRIVALWGQGVRVCETSSGRILRDFQIPWDLLPERPDLRKYAEGVGFTPEGEVAFYGPLRTAPGSAEVKPAVYFMSGRRVDVNAPAGRFGGFGNDGSIVVFGKGSTEHAAGPSAAIYVQRADGSVQTLSGYRGVVTSVAAAGERVLTVTLNGGQARIADARTLPNLLAMRGHKLNLHSVSLSADGAYALTTGSDLTARIWDEASGRLLHTLLIPSPPSLPPASPDTILTPPSQYSTFSPDGTRIVTANGQGMMRVWDSRTGRMLCSAKDDEDVSWVSGVSFLDGNDFVVTLHNVALLTFWDARTCRPSNRTIIPWRYVGFFDSIRTFLSTDGATLFTVYHPAFGFPPERTRELLVWNLRNVPRTLPASLSTPYTDLRYKGIELGITPGRLTLPENLSRPFAWGNDGEVKILAEWKNDSLRVWRPGAKRMTLLEGGRPGFVYATFSRDGTRVAAAYKNEVRVWNTDSGQLLVAFECGLDAKAGTPLALSTNGALLAVAMKDHTARIFPASNQGFFEVAGRLYRR